MNIRSLHPTLGIFPISAAALGFFLALSGTPAHAQETEVEMLRKQINELSTRLQKLEEAQAAAKPAPTATPTAAPPVQSNSKTSLVISGLLQEQGTAFFNQKNPAGTTANADTFRLRRGELRITAPKITDRMAATVMFDVGKTDNRTRAGSLLQELVLTYNVDKDANAPKFVDFGQFKPGFGYESDLVSTSQLQLVERAQIYSFRDLATLVGNAPFPGFPGGGLGDSRDQGIRLRGSLWKNQLAYNVGLFNGIGEVQNDTAKGDPKEVVARLVYQPLNTGWQFGLSGLTADTRNVSAGGPLDRTGFNTFAVYKKDKLTFQTEYSQLKSHLINNAGTFRNGKGYYVHLGYLITPKVELVGRYDSLKQELTAGNGTSKESTLGVNYYIKGHNAKIQADIVKLDGEPNALTTFDSIQLRTQVQAAF